MKIQTITTIISLFIGLTTYAQQEPEKVDKGYKVEIKTSAVCEMCKEAIESDLVFEKGVKDVNLDVDSKMLTVVYNEKKTDPQTIRKRVSKVGYHADDVKRDPIAYENLPLCCKDGAHSEDHH
ncbi:MAG: heavy metal-associated domain-containing protein [Marinoscillum sp.]